MRKTIITIFIILILLICGWTLHNMYEDFFTKADGTQGITGQAVRETTLQTPQDRISKEDIAVYPDRVVLNLSKAQWAEFGNSNSMQPTLGPDSNVIQIVPKEEGDIRIGDLVSYQSTIINRTILHRIIGKEVDEQGVYFILKGDNNPEQDMERVRFEQIERVVVAIIY